MAFATSTVSDSSVGEFVLAVRGANDIVMTAVDSERLWSVRSTDGGTSWSDPTVLDDTASWFALSMSAHPTGEVWAAAGTWNDVFALTPEQLATAGGGVVVDLRR